MTAFRLTIGSQLGRLVRSIPGIAGTVARFLWRNLWMTVFYIYLLAIVTLFVWHEDGALSYSLENLCRGMRSAFLPALGAAMARGLLLLGNPRRWRRIVAAIPTAILSLLSFSELWVSFTLHSRWSDRLIRLMADTNPSETGEFMERYLLTPQSAGLVLAFLLLSRAVYMALRDGGKALRISRVKGRRLAQQWGAVILIGAGIWWWSLPRENNYNSENSLNTAARLYKMTAAFRRSVKNVKALEKTPALADGKIADGYRMPARIIWVIGESDSKAHWSLYGYRLPTTPEMEKLAADSALIRFDDVVCFEPRTYRMMEILFSPYVVTDSTKYYLRQPLTPMILRKAGYKVRLHDNQATLLRGDDQAEVGTCNFMNSKILSRANFDYRNERMYHYDRELLAAEAPMLRDATPHTIDIFHLNGQHFSAKNRYPEGWDRFTAADYSGRKGFSIEERRQIAEYDNATRYVDAWLKALIDELQGEDAIVIYHPDHGEEMNDERHCQVRTMDSHINPHSAPYVLEIPFVVYATDEFRQLHPQLWTRLRKAASEPQSLIYFSHFFMDLAGVESKYLKHEYSPLSPEWKRPVRAIKGQTIGYDRWLQKYRPDKK